MQLYVDSLCYKTTAKAIRLALKDLERESSVSNDNNKSKALDHAYEQAMERINSQAQDFRELARQVLSWITFARRPLKPLELQHALAIEFGEPVLDKGNIPEVEDLISVCAGLVVVDGESNTIRLVHYTTQEYFARTCHSWFLNVRTEIAKSCVTYLLFDEFKTGPCLMTEAHLLRLEQYALCNYAAQNWGYHARDSSFEDIKSLIMELLQDDTKLSACAQTMMISRRDSYFYPYIAPTTIRGMHVAAYFGLPKAMIELIRNKHDLDLKDEFDQTPLHWAAWSKHKTRLSSFSKTTLNQVQGMPVAGHHYIGLLCTGTRPWRNSCVTKVPSQILET